MTTHEATTTTATLERGRAAGRARRGAPDEIAIRTLVYALILLGVAIVMVPFVWMLSTSLKSQSELFVYPPQWIPTPVQWSNYKDAWQALPFNRFLVNTLFMTLLAMFAEIFTASIVAYGFARFRFPLRNTLFVILLSTMMLPGILTLIPKFVMWRSVDRIDTFSPLTVGAWFVWGPSFVFLLRQFFMTIPREIEEAAVVDGANTVQIYWQIMLPLVRPALLAIGVLSFQANWNNFEGALIYLNTLEKYPLVLGLQFFGDSLSREAPKWNLMMAMSTVMAAPILLLFFLAQRYFIEGLTVGSVKG
ncbi:MAG TPA: carbohydrate ABC transporter permease [Thermomicrobiales bacterium]|nr:carbohydrate ABC transporter permease [Thermomicrobiales bacterium]